MASCSANRAAALKEPAPPLSKIAEKLSAKDKEARWEAISTDNPFFYINFDAIAATCFP